MKAVKMISVALAMCFFLLSLCACSSNETALTVDSTAVNKEIYGYFLSVAVNSDEYKEKKNKRELAGRLCAEYVAGCELIKKHGIQLSAEEKVAVSSEIKTRWQFYSSFYQKYSVSKQTLCAMLEHERLTDALTEVLYSKGGERELTDDEIKSFFNLNYVAARVAFTPFDETLTKEDVESITEKYTSMASIVRAGGEFSSAIEQYPDLADYEDTEHLIASTDSSYPKELFEKMSQLKIGDVQIMRFSRGIYLLQKADNSPFFDAYKSKCIVKMKKEEVLREICEAAKSSKLEYNSAAVKSVLSSADIK